MLIESSCSRGPPDLLPPWKRGGDTEPPPPSTAPKYQDAIKKNSRSDVWTPSNTRRFLVFQMIHRRRQAASRACIRELGDHVFECGGEQGGGNTNSTPQDIPQPWARNEQVSCVLHDAGAERTVWGAQDAEAMEACPRPGAIVPEDPDAHLNLHVREVCPVQSMERRPAPRAMKQFVRGTGHKQWRI